MIRIEKIRFPYLYIPILLVTLLIVSSCDPADNRLKIINNSNSDIYYYYSCDSSLENLHIYRTGYYTNSLGDSTYVIGSLVKKNSFRKLIMRLGLKAWIHYVKDCPNHELNVYIFSDSTVMKYSDIEIKDKRLFKNHFIMSLKDLKQNDWTVRYP